MAASSVASMQSVFLANPVTTYGAGKTRSSVGVVTPTLQRFPHKRQSSVVANASKTPSPPPTPPKVSANFLDLFAFSGPAPERINGRLAMVGFVSALGVELYKGQDVFAQISNGGVSLFVATSVLLSVASLVPLLKGASAESKSDRVMTSDAELWNGRMTMLGLVALVFTEYVKGGTLV